MFYEHVGARQVHEQLKPIENHGFPSTSMMLRNVKLRFSIRFHFFIDTKQEQCKQNIGKNNEINGTPMRSIKKYEKPKEN